jgi:hypothetical protein
VPGTDEYDTTADVPDEPRSRLERWSTRTGLLLLVLVVAAGAVGLLGPRKGSTSATAGGYQLAVEYPAITRAGEPAPLHVRVESDTGFSDKIQLALCDDLFDDLDFQNWYPNPAAETTVPPWIIYEFDPPPSGTTLEISLDARVSPGQFGETDDCRVSVLVQDEEAVSASFTSWRMP